jgi:hypothetical protein
MKKQFSVICRTKAEYAANGAGVSVPPQNFPSLGAAKSFMRTELGGGTVSFAEIYGLSGLVFRGRNPGGA